MKKRTKQVFPIGWNERRVRNLAAHYDRQTDSEAAREIEAGFDHETEAVVIVPKKLLPAVKKMIERFKLKAG